jgi:transcriptional regulator with XRE-family HTH domain
VLGVTVSNAQPKYPFVRYRGLLGSEWTQREFAKKAKVSMDLISKIERGGSIRASYAHRIHETLNQIRAGQDLPPIDFDEIDWNITGKKT